MTTKKFFKITSQNKLNKNIKLPHASGKNHFNMNTTMPYLGNQKQT